MNGAERGGPGAGPDDADLGRLLAEGLGQQTGGPVDERRLLSGAQRGAARIRRRRTAAVRVAAALVVALPLGAVAVQQLSRPDSATSAGSAVPASGEENSVLSEAASPAAPAQDAGSGAATGSPGPARASALASSAVPPASRSAEDRSAKGAMPSSREAAPLRRTASGQVAVPDDALLGEGDLPQFALTRSSDTANRAPAPAPPVQDTCGVALTGAPEAAGSREVVLDQRTDVPSSRWELADTVRVHAGGGAAGYLAAVRRLACVEPVTVLGADAALAGRSRDEQGRVHWYGVVQVGRTSSEVRLVAPGAGAPARDEIERLLRAAADRLSASGLPLAADGDPALG